MPTVMEPDSSFFKSNTKYQTSCEMTGSQIHMVLQRCAYVAQRNTKI